MTTPEALDASINDARTMPELFRARVALTPYAIAYKQFDPKRREWIGWTWSQIDDEVQRWRKAFSEERLSIGSRVATIMTHSINYVAVDQAALSLGLAIVPLHPTDNPGNVAYILQDCGASILVIDSPDYWALLAPEVSAFADLKRVVILSSEGTKDHSAGETDTRAVRAFEWTAIASTVSTPRFEISPEALAAIVYTSGTTGRPKGVMLSHKNVVSNVLAVLQRVAPRAEDLFLSFLPISHTFERTAGYYLPIASGSTVAFARSNAHLNEDLRIVSPTVLISVPRIYERVHLHIQEEVAKGNAVRRAIFNLTEHLGWRRFLSAQGDAPFRRPIAERLTWNWLDKLVATKIRAAFGGHLRVAVTGGAPMPKATSKFFLAMGVNILQGYGMTETAPVVSVNGLERNDPATVGEVISGVAVRIGANDELLVKGPNVMQGYWRRPEETLRALEPDGWLHTGDQAEIDNGRLKIKGRLKDIIVTSTGEKISPSDLEQAIAGDMLFEQAMVIGEQRPFIVALAVLNRAEVEREAKALGLVGEMSDIMASDAFQAFVLNRIEQAVAQFPKYAVPRKVWLTFDPWTVGAGLMTPTLKLKRLAIEKNFANEIAHLYAK